MDTNKRIQRGLDSLNFFLADVRDGLGPYLAIYLLTVQHWNEQRIGLVMTVMGAATVLCQVPAGALIDAIRRKRELIALAAACVALELFWLGMPETRPVQDDTEPAPALVPSLPGLNSGVGMSQPRAVDLQGLAYLGQS